MVRITNSCLLCDCIHMSCMLGQYSVVLQVESAVEQIVQKRTKRLSYTPPSDPLWEKQWSLVKKIDAHYLPACL